MRFIVLLGLISACIAADSAVAQTSVQHDEPVQQPASEKAPDLTAVPPNSAAVAQEEKAVVHMEEPASGDHWTYELHDQITGKLKRTFTQLVTEITATNISIRVDDAKTNESSFINYDRSWNVFKNNMWRFSPHDGTGIRLPLSVGQTWSFQADVINENNGIARKRTGHSKVVAQESLTTKAGTFDTFKIETSFTARDVNHPGMPQFQFANTIWYAPALDHWVKITTVMRTDGQLRENNLVELTEYGRKKASNMLESVAKTPASGDASAAAKP